ncbi:MAG: RNA 2',3'-cyclic phosphodiesterase [Desulfuromonadaceae bacterium]|nr:RNA 2',3'-cyclic phosphodiesterase [Desulfuromonadaceae bacterium]MDD2849080.1 RNA 2',3'-cyclic phosphodiesterase [Desulfuromonadaceae bacterium]MDD4131762.1 RNA 2',3'-cyclic phosphodiesterase [Desulfuromonadaceae bacterium]
MRLFIAIEIPDDLKKMIGRLRVEIPGTRWVQAEQIHLTLAFLGEVDEPTFELLNEELGRVKVPEFRLCFSGVGGFPDRHRPRVLWVGLEPQPRLQALAAMVRETVRACGIQQEERPFSPHVTLARLKLPHSRQADAFLDQPHKQKLPPFLVQEFTLFQSRLTAQGAVHVQIKNYRLAATADCTQRRKSGKVGT